ncbi:MAG: efflux RND transporter permease subunit [Syntrophales bacterium]|jgi:HAE1 family hydrophobic/amphiphilic exporter-1|nr:efflux RND transporter permease subunit [Syntrophales bacterium]MCK9528909.1 efflux RND transporter permease subunit [Syntrophales bacterium]MDX9922632.1 efflux RND transporter permease subunit [Syntrophales bacterium]
MNPARFTVRRPVFTIMATFIAVTIGMVSLAKLPIDLMPEVTYPTLTIMTTYENAAPEEMEELVTRPIEQAVAAVAGVEQINSNSSEGSSIVRVSFSWGTDIDAATNDIRDRLDRIGTILPDDITRPQVRKFDISATPILTLGVASPLDPLELRHLVDDRIRYRIERIPGIAAVDIWGGLEREIQVNLDLNKIQALGMTLDGIRQAIRDANITVPAGDIERGRFDVSLRTPGQFANLDELSSTVVAFRESAPITLDQVAEILDTHRRVTRIIRINDQPGVRLAVRKQPDANTVAAAQAVLRELENIHDDFPQVSIFPLRDASQYIRLAIDNVRGSILYGGALAVVLLLFFLRSPLSTLVVAVAIPVSVISTFALIYFGGFTLNLMTMGGLALGVGMMVDSSIVVLENIFRLREQERLNAEEAAIRGTGEVAVAIVAGTLTTLAIFLPMFFARELAGILFQQLAWVVGFALLASLFVALTVTPMLSARLIRPSREEIRKKNRFLTRLSTSSGDLFASLEQRYRQILRGALSRRGLVITAFGSAFLVSVVLVSFVGTEFMPAADEGEVRITIEMESGTRLALLDETVRRIEQTVVPAVPEATTVNVVIGGSSFRAGAAMTGDIRLALVPLAQRSRSSEQIADDLRGRLKDIPGVGIRTQASGGFFVLRLAAAGDDRLTIDVRGFDFGMLDSVAGDVYEAIKDVPGIADVRLSREDPMPLEVIRIDRVRAADLGLSVVRIARTIETAIAGSTAGQFRDGGSEYRIFMRLKDAELLDLDDILNVSVMNDRGEFISLRNVVSIERADSPRNIERQDQQRVSRVHVNISGRDLGSVASDIRDRIAALPVARDIDITFGADYEQQERAFGELGLGLIMAIALVYMVMACLYESLSDPLIVMFSVPMALIGVVAMLLATGTTINSQSAIGGIMLVGIVVNNAILIVDQAGRFRRRGGMNALEAALEAGCRRLRPILMTSLTTMMALMPLALGIGEGSEQQAPMARVVVGGLMSSTFITLILIPAIYSLFYGHRDGSPVSSFLGRSDQ